MKKEWLLLLASTGLTLLVALALLRWFAPQLLGIPVDLQMVRVGDEVPPFFDGVFRPEDHTSDQFILRDPYIKRARPLYPDVGEEIGMGPNDILGFRNRAVPNITDILCIGDSQTYGNNAVLEENWPNRLQAQLTDYHARQYSAAVGGWGPIEYLDILPKLLLLKPRVLIVAFYTGNDPIDGFVQTYGSQRWQHLRPNKRLSAGDTPPPAPNPYEPGDVWQIEFSDGISTIFTPRYRLVSNQAHPAVDAGYEIMAQVAAKILKMIQDAGQSAWYRESRDTPQLIFTIIPTKELVYLRKVKQSEITVHPGYAKLVQQEQARFTKLRNRLEALTGSTYVDVLDALQTAALQPLPLYPQDTNGHPLAAGYQVIATALRDTVAKHLQPRPSLAVKPTGDTVRLFLLNNRRYEFNPPDIAIKNGWKFDNTPVPLLSIRDIESLPYAGVIDTVEPQRFGPSSLPEYAINK